MSFNSPMNAGMLQQLIGGGGGEMTPQNPNAVSGQPQGLGEGDGNMTPQNPGGNQQQGGGMGGGGLAGLMQMIQQFHQNQGNGGGQTPEQNAGRGTGGMRGGDGTGGPGQGQGTGGQSGGQAPFNFGQMLQQIMQQRRGGASQGGYGHQQSFQQAPQMGGGGYHPMQSQQPSGGQYWNYHPQMAPPPSAGGQQAPSQGAPQHGAGSMVGGQFQPMPTGSGGSLYGMPEYGNSGVYSRSEGPQNTYFYNGNNKQWGDESNQAFQNQFGGKQGQ